MQSAPLGWWTKSDDVPCSQHCSVCLLLGVDEATLHSVCLLLGVDEATSGSVVIPVFVARCV